MKNNILNRKFKYAYWNVTLWIILINVLMFFILRFVKPSINGLYLGYYLCLIPDAVTELHWFWQFFTYMFCHTDSTHLLFNMYALFLFGKALERTIGSKEFLLLYVLSGLFSGFAAFVFYKLTGAANVLLLGASGAIFAIEFTAAVMFPYTRILFWFIPMRLPLSVLLMMLIEEINLISNVAVGVQDSISHICHIGGIAMAWIYCLVRFRISPAKIFGSLFDRR